jgi:hypothetical protein
MASRIEELEQQVADLLQRVRFLVQQVFPAVEEDLFGPADKADADPPRPSTVEVKIYLWHVARQHPDTTDLMVCVDDTLAVVKEKIELQEGYPRGRLRLISDAHEMLRDDKTIGDYSIEDGDIVRVVLQPECGSHAMKAMKALKSPRTGAPCRITVSKRS